MSRINPLTFHTVKSEIISLSVLQIQSNNHTKLNSPSYNESARNRLQTRIPFERQKKIVVKKLNMIFNQTSHFLFVSIYGGVARPIQNSINKYPFAFF